MHICVIVSVLVFVGLLSDHLLGSFHLCSKKKKNMSDRLKLEHLTLRKDNGEESRKSKKEMKRQHNLSHVSLPAYIRNSFGCIVASIAGRDELNAILNEIQTSIRLFLDSSAIGDQIKSFQILVRISFNKINNNTNNTNSDNNNNNSNEIYKIIDQLFFTCLQLYSLPMPKDFIKVKNLRLFFICFFYFCCFLFCFDY